MGGLNSKHLFFTVLESGKSQIKVQADLVSAEELLPGLQMAVFLYPHVTESRDSGEQAVSCLSFLGPTPIHEASPFMPSHLTKVLPPKSTTLGIGLLHMNVCQGRLTNVLLLATFLKCI